MPVQVSYSTAGMVLQLCMFEPLEKLKADLEYLVFSKNFQIITCIFFIF